MPDPIHTPAAAELVRLLEIMAALRHPLTGCPWDQEQNFDSIAPFTIEEAYEVADAIGRQDWQALPDELGDLLLQVVYYASLGQDDGRFDFAAIARAVSDKMVRRHPHVFGEADAAGLRQAWEAAKQTERAARFETGVLAGIPHNQPALLRAAKLCARSARVGFDWEQPGLMIDKLIEELHELKAELAARDEARLRDEMGDVLFTMANLARGLGLDPEHCLRQANAKFERRFAAMERHIEAEGGSVASSELTAMEAAWQAVKAAERAQPASNTS